MKNKFKALADRISDKYLKKINRECLRLFLSLYNLNKQQGITVVIAIKDRYDHKIINSLKSIRNQDYPQNLIKITIVDYDSKEKMIQKFKDICKKYNVKFIRVEKKPIWNRAHCLNIGIKRAKTKYVLTSDVDIIYEKNYITEAVKALQKNPFQVILCQCMDSPAKMVISDKTLKEYDNLRKKSKYRSEVRNIPSHHYFFGKGINLTLTYFYHKINGYDEKYIVWGKEDDDLIKRFNLLGLQVKDITNRTSYIHQWHTRVENKEFKKQVEINEKYLHNNHSIMRNKEGWGKIK